MYYSRYVKRSPSPSSETSNQPSSVHGLKSPVTSDYEYLGRLVTRERPIARKPKPVQQNLLFPPNNQKYYHSMRSDRREIYRDEPNSSSEEDNVDPDGLNKPLGVIRISDRHYREIYRLPTPPPKVKRVFHRLRSPEPKIIERVFVRRPPPQIIENVIEVPQEKVRIINREKYLEKSAPITRSKLVHLKSGRQRREEEEQQYQETHLPFKEQMLISMDQEGTTIPSTTTHQSPQANTTLVYPPQQNMRTVGYIKSTVPPEVMFNTQQPLQIPASQIFNPEAIQPSPYDNPPQQTIQPTPYDNPPQQTIQPTPYDNPLQQTVNQQMVQPTPQSQPNTSYQMVQPTTFNYPSQQPVSYQMAQPTSFAYPTQQPTHHQMAQPTPFAYPTQQPTHHQMVPPTPFTFPSQPTMPFFPYGYPQY